MHVLLHGCLYSCFFRSSLPSLNRQHRYAFLFPFKSIAMTVCAAPSLLSLFIYFPFTLNYLLFQRQLSRILPFRKKGIHPKDVLDRNCILEGNWRRMNSNQIFFAFDFSFILFTYQIINFCIFLLFLIHTIIFVFCLILFSSHLEPYILKLKQNLKFNFKISTESFFFLQQKL